MGLVALVGIVFTFALPTPNNSQKAQSTAFARLYLFAMWLVQVATTMKYLNVAVLYGLGFYLFALLSAYMLMMTVIKRYGMSLTSRQFLYCISHASIVLAITQYYYWVDDMPVVRNLVLLLNCAVPVFVARQCIKPRLRNSNQGDVMLYTALHIALVVVLGASVVYGLFEHWDAEWYNMISFGLILILMMLFMLAFSVSVVHSLVHRLHYQLNTDPLTGAKNRHFFYEVAPRLSMRTHQHHQRLSVVACDIDHFKRINDEYGHVVGDKALKRFSQIIQQELRSEDTLIRMGGEEFLVLSPNCNLEQVTLMAERLREKISHTVLECENHLIEVTASFGVVEIDESSDIFAGIKSADDALIKAKNRGRNQVVQVRQLSSVK